MSTTVPVRIVVRDWQVLFEPRNSQSSSHGSSATQTLSVPMLAMSKWHCVGAAEGSGDVGARDGEDVVGTAVGGGVTGAAVGFPGSTVGERVGVPDGGAVDGDPVGAPEGEPVGARDGELVGAREGEGVGPGVGPGVGDGVGPGVGPRVGPGDPPHGADVGAGDTWTSTESAEHALSAQDSVSV